MDKLTSRLIPFVPFLFVLLWSTGFIGAKYGLPYIEPFYFLFIRMLATLFVFFVLMIWFKNQWLSSIQSFHQIVTGSLVHAGYLGGVFAAISLGMPAGVAAIIVGLQPLLTAIIGRLWLNQPLSRRQLVGLLCGLSGVSLVVGAGQDFAQIELSLASVVAAVVALFSISIGTLYQKRFGSGVNLVTGSFYQYLATAVWMGLLAYSLETRMVVWSGELIFALTWLVLGLSVTAILLLMYMIREGEAARVASYFYLVPPVTVIEAWLLFDESLSALSLFGIGITVLGVYLVLKTSNRPS